MLSIVAQDEDVRQEKQRVSELDNAEGETVVIDSLSKVIFDLNNTVFTSCFSLVL